MSLFRPDFLWLRRTRLLVRAARAARGLEVVHDRTDAIPGDGVLVFATIRNEAARLPFFLSYYRNLGVAHFLIVDNGSEDGTAELLGSAPDVSVWSTQDSYRRARFGVDWMNHLLRRYGTGHWCLTVDADEYLVFPFCDARPLPALTDWLTACGIRSFSAMLLDMYPQGPIDAVRCPPGRNPFDTLRWFDGGNYTQRRNPVFRNLWIQGGPRARAFFADRPDQAPALNKIPLVRWERHFAYRSSTHTLLPRGLNLVYDEWGGEKASGCLLHAKFAEGFAERAVEEAGRRQHYARAREYAAYVDRTDASGLTLWHPWSERYTGWRQLESLGLMSTGNWA